MTVPRFWVIPPDKDGIYSISSRCVRRGFLLGKDPYTGTNYDHRKEWVRSGLDQRKYCQRQERKHTAGFGSAPESNGIQYRKPAGYGSALWGDVFITLPDR